ncbi:MAG: glycine/betaine/sarcosine/D-proline family reductase selenoprotein B [SAR202 cluster bacterium]|nr:glycine/betaine/sarcosine/D-proline family reductase selenoprotein B [Chloroflexota bacterium]MQG57479.1 glycine/betaine/sarcosine/D-proline family reductase selenoprotein B [SAR202 cluster bacterium]MQG67508.1 glycine/betaine/sarcosine/D-proline family reductase selenoprotein B [SAR202 cluster bacterium]HAL47171.1 glycine/betaine/sarcosine/D-proline family reductase selenoprotein B [Dehalococcoidia bacterium]
MADPIRVLHYINQFFGGMGGEEEANAPPELREGAVGPGRALEQALGDGGTVVGTIVAGDNYVVEEHEAAMTAVRDAITRFDPDLVVAGPAFEAGRYGLACADVCVEVQNNGIQAVTGMFEDNPGVIAHRQEIYCVPTGTSAVEMPAVLKTMAALGLKLAEGAELGPASEEGYMPRGLRRFVMRDSSGAERAADMLKARLNNQPFTSEVFIKQYEVIPPPAPVEKLSDVTVALITTGAVVPKGNPDDMPAVFATDYFTYSIEGLDELMQDEWESVHAGFNTGFINTHDPNYALPLAAVRQLEKEGIIGSVFPRMYSLPGVATAQNDSLSFGAKMANELKDNNVGAALLVAT